MGARGGRAVRIRIHSEQKNAFEGAFSCQGGGGASRGDTGGSGSRGTFTPWAPVMPGS